MTEPRDVSATRVAYDIVAADYAELLRSELAGKPLDRALLRAFADLVQADGGGSIADVGCGPGRVTAYLRSLGTPAFGVDLSPEMVAVARRTYPDIRFDEGSMTALDARDGELGGIVAWYSVIHTPPPRLPATFAEFHRVLLPGGYVLLAFQVGDEYVHLEHAYGHDISLDAYRLPLDLVAQLLGEAGFLAHAQLVREPEDREKLQQGYVLVRKPQEGTMRS